MSSDRSSGSDRRPVAAILALSFLVAAFLVWLIYFKEKLVTPGWANNLPLSNAIFNSVSAVCLSLGYLSIRRGNKAMHRRFMLGATASSACFLLGYITYHYFHGDTKFPGQGWIRPAYFSILISHIGLSIVSLPLIFATLWYSLTGQFLIHRKVAQWTLPLWLYVSVTGVLVFVLLKSQN